MFCADCRLFSAVSDLPNRSLEESPAHSWARFRRKDRSFANCGLPDSPGETQMKRYAILIYGLVCYVVFFATFLYAIWFVFTMDAATSEVSRPLSERLLIEAGLLSIFALQHSIMARQSFKSLWTRIIPAAAERSMCSSQDSRFS